MQEWKEVRLGDVATIIVSNVDKKKRDGESPVRLCNYTDVYNRDSIEPSQEFMEATATLAQIKKFGIRVGDVLITKDSETADDIAVPTYVAETADDLVCGYHLAIIRHGKEIDGRFLKSYFELPHTRYYFGSRANGVTRFGLTIDGIRGAKLHLPPLAEQRKIAKILSTWDKAIETTDALLATARTQKRALMQSLLNGKRRFPRFEGQVWREVRLGAVANIIVSNVDKKSKDDEHPIRLCNYTDVYKCDIIDPSRDFMKATATLSQIKKFGLKAGDVVITKDSETADDIAMPTYVAETADDLVCGYHLAIVRPSIEVDGKFLKFFFELPHTRYYFGTRANGAIRFGLTIDGIQSTKLYLPSVEEQCRIASVIAEAEIEIATILADIEKLRTEKKTLMQQLLTGKRRVTI